MDGYLGTLARRIGICLDFFRDPGMAVGGGIDLRVKSYKAFRTTHPKDTCPPPNSVER
jgi:hypothetical protein